MIIHSSMFTDIMLIRARWLECDPTLTQQFEIPPGTLTITPNKVTVCFVDSSLKIEFCGDAGDGRDIVEQFHMDASAEILAVAEFFLPYKKVPYAL